MSAKDADSIVSEFNACFPQMSQELGRANLEKLLEGASVQEYPAGRTLIRDRMPVDYLYFVLSGTLSAYIEEDGNSMMIANIKAGEWMGEISVLSGEFVASATIITTAPCKLVKVHHVTFEKLISENETVAKVMLDHFIRLMAERFRAPLSHPLAPK